MGPEVVAFFGEVKLIGHDALGEFALFVHEGSGDVEVVDLFAIGELGDLVVGSEIYQAAWVCVGLAAGEDREEEDFGFWGLCTEFLDDLFHAIGDLGGGGVHALCHGPGHIP